MEWPASCFRIDLDAAVGRGADIVRKMSAVAFHLPRPGIVQKGANGGGPDIEAYNEGIRAARSVGHSIQNDFPL